MKDSKPVFFDASGKRRKVVNISLLLFITVLVVVVSFVVFYVLKLNEINQLVATTMNKPVSSSTNVTVLYTDNSPKAFPVLSDRIEKIDTLLIPKYWVTTTAVVTPDAYKNLINDVDFVSKNKPVHYNPYYILSATDYGQPPSDRIQAMNDLLPIDSRLPTLITAAQMKALRDDLLASAVSGVYLDFDISVINNQSSKEKYERWFGDLKSLLNASDLQIGLMIKPGSINQYNRGLVSSANRLYVSFRNDQTVDRQISLLKDNASSLGSNITYEMPTVSWQVNERVFGSYPINVDYVTAQKQMVNVNFSSRGAEPLKIAVGLETLFVEDAVTSYNVIHALNASDLLRPNTEYAVADPGFEEYTVWSLLENPYETIRNKYLLSENLIAALDIQTNGEGQVFRLDSNGKAGHRSLQIAESGQITGSVIDKTDSVPIVTKTGRLPKKIALTFDDGPHATNTKKVLDILDRYKVKGTFFVVGQNVLANTSVAKELVTRGHEIENHTFDHPVFSSLTEDSQINQIKANSQLIETVTGQKVHYFRKPYSDDVSINTEDDVKYLEKLKALGLQASEYDIDSKDWLLDSSDEVVNKVIKDLENSSGEYSQILFHDAHKDIERTTNALPRIIEYLQRNGIEIVRVDQLTNVSSQAAITTKVYRAIEGKNLLLTAFVWTNTVLIALSLLKYLWMFAGSFAYGIKQLVRRLLARRKKFRSMKPSRQKIAIIIACYNEEKVIGRTLCALLDNTYQHFSIIVVDDGSTDNTSAVVKAFCDIDKRIKLITVPNGGKAKALDIGIKRSRAAWLVFCDADTIFDKDALLKLSRRMHKNPKLGALAGHIMVGNDINWLTRAQVIEYGIAHAFIKPSQDVINSVTVVPGALGLWNRKVLTAVGGFESDTLAEDADATMKVIRYGKRVNFEGSVTAKTEAPSDLHMLYKQRTRWQLGNMQAVIKHRRGLFNLRYRALGFVGLPLFCLDIITTLFYPPLLVFAVFVVVANIRKWHNIIPYNVSFITSKQFLIVGLVLVAIEILLALVAILKEKKPFISKIKLLITLPYYLTFYKSFLSFATIVAMLRALRGTLQGWGHLKRTATVK